MPRRLNKPDRRTAKPMLENPFASRGCLEEITLPLASSNGKAVQPPIGANALRNTIQQGSWQGRRKRLPIPIAEKLYYVAAGIEAWRNAAARHYPLARHVEVSQVRQCPFHPRINHFRRRQPTLIRPLVITSIAPGGIRCGHIGHLHQRRSDGQLLQ